MKSCDMKPIVLPTALSTANALEPDINFDFEDAEHWRACRPGTGVPARW